MEVHLLVKNEVYIDPIPSSIDATIDIRESQVIDLTTPNGKMCINVVAKIECKDDALEFEAIDIPDKVTLSAVIEVGHCLQKNNVICVMSNVVPMSVKEEVYTYKGELWVIDLEMLTGETHVLTE